MTVSDLFFPFDPSERRDQPAYRGMRGYAAGRDGFVGIGGCAVAVTDGAGTRALRHFERHSREGFEWGFPGSGAAELARCLLVDALALEPVREGAFETFPEIDTLYPLFKFAVVAALARDSWELSRADVLAWYQRHEVAVCAKHRVRLQDRRGATVDTCAQCADEAA